MTPGTRMWRAMVDALDHVELRERPPASSRSTRARVPAGSQVGLLLQLVEEPTSGKNRTHFDIEAPAAQTE